MTVDRRHRTAEAGETRPHRTDRADERTEFARPRERRHLGDDRVARTGPGANALSRDRAPTAEPTAAVIPSDQSLAAVSELEATIRSRIEDGAASRYFGRGTTLSIENHRLVVSVTNGFLGAQIERRFARLLDEVAREHGASGTDFRVQPEATATTTTTTARPGREAEQHDTRVDRDPSGPTRPGSDRAAPARRPAPQRRMAWSEQHTFENFVIGTSNRVAAEAARLFARGEAPTGLLVLHGPCGVGKTHLLNAIGHETRRHFRGARIRVTDSERFLGEYVASVRNNTMDAFRKRHRELDLLCLDDAHGFAGKAKTQQELVHTLQALAQQGVPVALVSDEPPEQIEAMQAALASRLSGGLVVRIDPPEPDLRVRIAQAVGARRRLPIDEAACRALAEGSVRHSGPQSGVRELEGLVKQAEAIWRFEGGSVGVLGVETAIRAVAARGGAIKKGVAATGPVSIKAIIAASCRELGVELAEFAGRTRVRRVVLARSLAVYVARQATNLSFPEIARAMKRPNHSTVITQCRSMETRAEAGELVAAGTAFDGLTIPQAAERLATAARQLDTQPEARASR